MEFWPGIRMIWDRMQENAPDGFEAQVTVYVRNSQASFTPYRVSRWEPWRIFEGFDDQQRMRVVGIKEEMIERVEVHYVPAKAKSAGFQIAQAEEIAEGTTPHAQE